jgi:hypothetical protein
VRIGAVSYSYTYTYNTPEPYTDRYGYGFSETYARTTDSSDSGAAGNAVILDQRQRSAVICNALRPTRSTWWIGFSEDDDRAIRRRRKLNGNGQRRWVRAIRPFTRMLA